MAKTKEQVSVLMQKEILYYRFTDIKSLEKEITKITEESANLQEAEQTEEEIKEMGCDYQLDGTFGEGKFGTTYADFVIYYLKDNSDNILVTGFAWM